MSNIETINNCYRFEKIVLEMFNMYGFNTYIPSKTRDFKFDFMAQNNEISYAVEVKCSRNINYPSRQIYNIASFFEQIKKDFNNSIRPVLVIGAVIPDAVRKQVEDTTNIFLLDIQNIIYMLNANEKLYNELLFILEFSVNGIIPKKPYIDFPFGEKLTSSKSYKYDLTGDNLKNRVLNWNHSSSRDYEKLCFDVLKYLFSDELCLWREQNTSNTGLYRFDLICKIKDEAAYGLWNTIFHCFKTKYIIFEFKDYKNMIEQSQIYTTEKYLYLKALRGVAIIISCKGASKNAEKAIRGVLRENGKLILSISNKDLIRMIDKKINKENPSDYLYDKFDNMLIELEK